MMQTFIHLSIHICVWNCVWKISFENLQLLVTWIGISVDITIYEKQSGQAVAILNIEKKFFFQNTYGHFFELNNVEDSQRFGDCVSSEYRGAITVTSKILEGMFFLDSSANMQSTRTLLHTRM